MMIMMMMMMTMTMTMTMTMMMHWCISPLTPQTCMISLDGLGRFIHTTQLTQEFDGNLPYDNDEWIELRLVCD